MKKVKIILSYLFVLTFVISSLSIDVFAENNTVITPVSLKDMEDKAKDALNGYYNSNTESFSILYKDDQDKFLSKNFKIANGNLTPYFLYLEKEQFSDLMYTPGNDYATVCIKAGNSFNLASSFSYNQKGAVFEIKANYTIDWGESSEQRRQVETFAEEKVSKLCNDNMRDEEKVKVLHDFIVNNFEYDKSFRYYHPYEMIENNTGVCQAYAGLMWQLLDKAGIESRIILKDSFAGDEGETQSWAPHAWNLVNLDGKWYHIDATWDDPITTNGTQVLRYDYYLKDDSYMRKTHTWSTDYPAATTKKQSTVNPSSLSDTILINPINPQDETPKPESKQVSSVSPVKPSEAKSESIVDNSNKIISNINKNSSSASLESVFSSIIKSNIENNNSLGDSVKGSINETESITNSDLNRKISFSGFIFIIIIITIVLIFGIITAVIYILRR